MTAPRRRVTVLVGLVVLVATALAAPAFVNAQPCSRVNGSGSTSVTSGPQSIQAARGRIEDERKALQRSLSNEEATCYQKFAVEDCLRQARGKARSVQNALRAQELELNNAQRRQREAQRARLLEEKRAGAAAAAAAAAAATAINAPVTSSVGDSNGQNGVEQRAAPAALPPTTEGHGGSPIRVNRVRDAQAQQAQQAARAATQANANRDNQTKKRQAAEVRRARVQQSLSEASAQGRPPAAPLPVPDDVGASPRQVRP